MRSASYCLGALQELQIEGKLKEAKSVTAVSGGAYVASGWAIAAGEWPAHLFIEDSDPSPRKGAEGDYWVKKGMPFLAVRTKGEWITVSGRLFIGQDGPDLDEGADGDYWVNESKTILWGPKHGGQWPPAASGDAPEPLLFSHGSPEEKWVRLHSSNLVGSALVLCGGALRLIAGVLFGWMLIWLLMFALTQPLGWVVSWVHPELRARTPLVQIKAQPTYVDSIANRVTDSPNTDPPYALYAFAPRYTCAQLQAWKNTYSDANQMSVAALATKSTGLVRIQNNEATIVAQPGFSVVNASEPPAGTAVCSAPTVTTQGATYEPPFPLSTNATGPTLSIGTAPTFTLAKAVFSASDPDQLSTQLASAINEDRSAAIVQKSGMTGRDPISFDYWQWLIGCALLAAGFGLYLGRVLWRPFNDRVLRCLAGAGAVFASVGILWLLVFVVLPWCVQEVPPFLANLSHAVGRGGQGTGVTTGIDRLLAVLGITGLLAAALKAFAQLAIKYGRTRLGFITKLAIGVLLPLVGAIVFVDLLEFATANGPFGRFMGFGIGMRAAVTVASMSWARLIIVVLVLLLLATVDAHAWSMFPWYKRRLNGAYAVSRDFTSSPSGVPRSSPVHYTPHPVFMTEYNQDPERPFTQDDDSKSHGHLLPSGGPELVICCAANVSNSSVAPPGRRSVSFTVSEEWIGSPEIGFVATAEYLKSLSRRRRSDITLPSLMAISGAAISPGMGKMSRGPIDSLLALLNVRLGVWLPNPAMQQRFRKKEDVTDAQQTWSRRWWPGSRPWWSWYLREVFGLFKSNGRFLYISDGGHWENLGLVELFRRGCTEIYCISAAGGDLESFATLGEAIAMAQETLGVEIDIDLTNLRPGKVEDAGRRLLRRKGGSDKSQGTQAEGWSPDPYAVGTFTYPAPNGGGEGVKGSLLLIEANLSKGVPWDVQAWAEANQAFPDDPTSDQQFDYRQFESYLRLGRFQMRAGLDSETWHRTRLAQLLGG